MVRRLLRRLACLAGRHDPEPVAGMGLDDGIAAAFQPIPCRHCGRRT